MKKTKLLLVIGFVLFMFSLISCGEEENTNKDPIVNEVTYTITFISNGGTSVPKQITGRKAKRPTSPTREGYIFAGWYEDSSLEYEFDFVNTELTGNLVLYAKWEAESKDPDYANVYFNSKGGSVVSNLENIKIGSKIDKPTDPVREGYTFVGWYKDTGGELTEVFNFAEEIITRSITLYARWSIKQFTITFDSNEGTPVESQMVTYRKSALRPTSPTKEGYLFVGWYKDVNLKHEFDFVNTVIVQDYTLYAKWEKIVEVENKVKVVFNSKDGSPVPTLENVVVGSKIEKPVDPTRDGYTFVGWYKDTGGELTEAFDFANEIIDKNITLYAKWNINTYILSFDSNGGSPIESQSILAFENATRPTSPTKEGYLFVGWYKDTALEHEFDFVNMMIVDNITLYAKWEKDTSIPDKVKVVFNSKDGSPVPTLENVVVGSKIEKPADPTRDGYVFVGWYKDTGGELTEAFNFAEDVILKDTTLYAKWEKIVANYTIFFEANGGSQIPSKIVQENDILYAPTAPTRDGYTFKGWFTDALCTLEYVFGNPVTANITLYAKWERVPVEDVVTTNFDFSGFHTKAQQNVGTDGKTTLKITHGKFVVDPGVKTTQTELNTQGKIITFTLDGTVSNGFTVTGKGGSGKKTSPGTTVLTLYKLVNGEYVLVKDLGSVVYDNMITVTEQDLEAGTYQFRTDKSLKISAFSLTERNIGYVLEEFTVSFNYQNGTPETSVTVQEGKLVTRPADPVYEGYVFGGWFTNALYVTQFDFSTPIITDVVLYAKWEEEPIDPNDKTYTIKFVTDCDAVLEDKVVVEGKKLLEPAGLVREGYRFMGWYVDQTFNTLYNFSDPVTSNFTLYAKWQEVITYTVSFENNGFGDALLPISKLTSLPELPKLDSAEKSFGGWFYDKGLTEKALAGDALEADVTLYAKWNEKSGVEVIRALGNLETAYIEWKPVADATSYNVYYKKASAADSAYTAIDKMLIREYKEKYRADVLGLAAGNYTLKVVPVFGLNEADTGAIEDVSVLPHDRSGFAFSNDSPLKTASGAYNADGTLRQGAQVIYVTAKNAKTVKATVRGEEFVGFQNIIYGKQKAGSTDILDFRIVGEIKRDDLDGYLSSAEGVQIKGAKAYQDMNITIEGVGEDATFNGFGFLIRSCGNVEMRNFGIVNFMDDGISIDTNNCNLWIHNVDFFYGSPGGDSDQAKGDGSLDIKKHSRYITASYNHFWDSGKCNLQGMKSEATEDYITYHHNWYDHSDSRHPRIRTCSVHVYNNYFDGNSKYGVGITMGGSAFVENNYFRNCNNPMLSSKQGTDSLGKGTFSGETGGIIKAYGNYIEGGQPIIWYADNNTSFDAYQATSRNEKLPSTVKTLAGGTSYNNFDTSANFYTYKVDTAEAAKENVMKYAGRINGGDLQFVFDNAKEDTNYDIIPELKQMVLNYKTTLIRILGES